MKAAFWMFLILAVSRGWGEPPVVSVVPRTPVNPVAFSGGAGTTFNAGREAYSTPLTNLTRTHRREFVVGNSFFKDNWVSAPATAGNRDGLGPLFHARSCSSCHVQDGRGAPPVADEVMTGLLLRLSVPGSSGPVPDPIYGNQIAVRALPGTDPEADVRVRWKESEVILAGGETVKLRRPDIEVVRWYYGEPSAGFMISPRLAPPVYGGGLLEAVPESAVEALADPDDKDHDGISGRVNHAVDTKSGRKVAGRFGWKASVATLRMQAAEAFAGDIGITTNEHPQENYSEAQAAKLGSLPGGGKPEADALIMDRMESYLRGLGVPARRKVDDATVRQGESVFRSLNCAACHVSELRTGGDYAMAELRDQTIRPYTDLLIHDMGPDLADHRPDGEASGMEWRTAPLWGLGLNATVNGNTFYLHDGRARTITEAILWHGGEAGKSRDAFKLTAKESRAALVAFLESL